MPRARTTTSLAGPALGAAALVGAGWALDAWLRDRRLRSTHRILVDLLLNALTADDPGTARHSRRVADLSFVLAETACLPRRERATLRVAALLHDMGKIDDRFFHIVHSRRPLTPEQRAEIKHHPHQSAHILEPMEPLHPGIIAIVSSHHECWDGSGYPRGLAGGDIPLGARIIALADVFDALTQPRKYRGPLPVDEALDEIGKGSGRQFDPGLVRLLDAWPVADRWAEIACNGRVEERLAAAEGDEEDEEEDDDLSPAPPAPSAVPAGAG
ncbi:MAG TPA: HD domain-containing phosphohydrolase [Longimicrobiaceae bacterium]|nr:HD domain-containing phosphohydrolase [Longimicrobiaceae bacterium]